MNLAPSGRARRNERRPAKDREHDDNRRVRTERCRQMARESSRDSGVLLPGPRRMATARGGRAAGTALDRLSVRTLTRVFSWATHIDPACWDAWEKRIGALPKDVGERYNTRLLTPRDWASHFKNILHRTLMVRSITTGDPCRCCNFARENIIHFATCEVAGKLWSDLCRETSVAIGREGRAGECNRRGYT